MEPLEKTLTSNSQADEIREAIAHLPENSAISIINRLGLEISDKELRTPLFHAIIKRKEIIIRWLLLNGADLNHQDINGSSPLHFAVQENLTDIVTLLLENGAKVDIRDRQGNTPLWKAVFEAGDNYELIKILLENNADPEIKNNDSLSALDLAIDFGDLELENMLEKA
jgi:ankyrin repeat protein